MSGGDFLSRWSRRKREVEAVEQTAPPAMAVADAVADVAPEMSAEEIALLPPLETLTAETDLSQFLRAGVPTLLRNAALRRMWSVDPAIRDYVCEAREYAYDWNVVGGVPGTGPMLPTDDIDAMVREVFGGSPAPEPPPEPPPEIETAELEDCESEEPEPDDDAGEPVAGLDSVAVAPLIVETLEPARPSVAVDPDAKPLPVARMRRHGGAIPL